jgi:tetratricopeptide (TPR) repeat protein
MWMAAGLVAAIALIYANVSTYRFINFDDDAYILNNPPVRAGLTAEGIAWAFTSIRHFYWQPLTWLSHMLDCQIYGLNPGGHHVTSVIIHAANAVLLLLLLWRLTGSVYRGGFVAALFALHPLRVESVAWIAERKDVLSGFFCLLCLLLYVRYVDRPSRLRYLAVVAVFSAALMSKPMAVTLPVAMLLLDYWPLHRPASWGKLFVEKLPLFLLSAVVSALTLAGQQEMGALASLDAIPLWSRVGNAIVAYAEYLAQTAWPHDLAIFYPFPAQVFLSRVLPALALLIAISVLAFLQRRRRPWLIAGWCWFVVILAPTIGIIQVGSQALADRFTYLPQIGLFVAAVWTVAELLSQAKQGRLIAIALAVTVLPALAVASHAQTGYWPDSLAVCQHAIDVTSANPVMEANLGFALAEQGRRAEAIAHYSRSLALQPVNYRTQYNLGKSLVEDNRPLEAEPHFRESARLKPDYAEAHYALATVLYGQHALADAAREFDLALTNGLPTSYLADAHNNLGVIYAQQALCAEAAPHFAAAARLKPELTAAHLNYAQCLVDQNKPAEARAYLARTLQSGADNPDLRRYLDRLDTRLAAKNVSK